MGVPAYVFVVATQGSIGDLQVAATQRIVCWPCDKLACTLPLTLDLQPRSDPEKVEENGWLDKAN